MERKHAHTYKDQIQNKTTRLLDTLYHGTKMFDTDACSSLLCSVHWKFSCEHNSKNYVEQYGY
jgi:hypothetical protein